MTRTLKSFVVAAAVAILAIGGCRSGRGPDPTSVPAKLAVAGGPARGCVTEDLTWKKPQWTIPVCWETTQPAPAASAERCRCADGMSTAAACTPALCERVCRDHGGPVCDFATTLPLEVCTGMAASECARLREVVRQAVHGTWESNSQVRFVGWGVCAGTGVTGCQGVTSDGVQGVRIRVRAGRGAACPGTSIDGVADGMNFELAGRSDDQIRRTAVHEFGHALGFLHEQDRKDTPEWCQEEQGQTGCSSVGVWDASSIMNYCNPNYFSTPAYLSAVDIATVRQVYDTGTIAACSAGLQKCESVCVNQAVDVRHCGACGTACAEGSACIGGVCQSCACAPNSCGNTPCGNACACGINQICNGTACVNVPPPCPLGSRVCGDQCVNIQSSPRHCGECNNACGDAEKCIRGKCIEVGGCHPPTPYRCPDGNCARNRSDCPR